MKSFISQWVVFMTLVLVSYHGASQTIRTVGSGGNYSNLQAAFDAINTGNITGDIELQIISNTVETSTTEATAPTLNASGSGSANYSSVAIYPTGAGGYTISTADFYQLIILNGADNVTIDGRVNRTGSTTALTLEHQHTTSNRARTIEFRNSAENNVIRYCKITGSLRANQSGVIHFTNSTAGSGDGNSYNTIEYCEITNTNGVRPRHLMYSNADSEGNIPNTGNIIRYNKFYDFINPAIYNSQNLSTAINLTARSSNWTITGNSFYEITNFEPTDAMNYAAIRVSTGDYHNTITNNFIGGSQPQCGGLAWHTKSIAAHSFTGIYYSSSSTTNTSIIQGNIIQNFDYESRSINTWRGIDIHSFSANNILIDNNTIGSKTGIGGVSVNAEMGGTELNTIGIRLFGPGSYTVSNNYIGSINAAAFYHQAHNLYGLIKESGSANIHASSNNFKDMQTAFGNLRGIEIGGNGGYAFIENSTIRNLTSSDDINTPNVSSTIGILITSTAIGTNDWHNIDDNLISNLSTNTENLSVLALAGIAVNTSSATKRRIRRNTIHNISSTATGDVAVHAYGIYHSAGASTIGNGRVSENFIHSINLASNSDNATAAGIRINSGRAEYFNNIINVGGSLSGGYNVYGIFHEGDRYNRYYFNTVYIGGSVLGGNDTYAFLKTTANAETSAFNDDLRNSIFVNARTNTAGSAKHYAISLPGTTRLTINRNNYYTPVTGGVLGFLTSDQTTLAAWQSATGQDANSLNIDPQFANAGGTDASDYIPAATMTGQSITGFTSDYFGITRSTNEMGALLKSYVIWTGTNNTAWATATNWKDNNAPVAASNVIIPDVTNDPVITTTGNIVNSLNIEVNGRLTVSSTGTLTVSNNLKNIRGIEGLVIKSDATAGGSLIHSTTGVNATVERYIARWTNDFPNHGWHFLSSPVASQPIRPEFVPNTNPITAYVDFYKWDEPSQLWINVKDGSGNWNTGFEDDFVVGRGYLMAYGTPPEKSYGNKAHEFMGVINVSDVSFTGLTNSGGHHDGWHLLGNPFSSAIKFDQGSWNKTNIGAYAQIWNESNASYKVLAGNQIIPAHNGFMVYTSGSGSLTIPADARLHSDSAWYKNNAASENEIILLARDPQGQTAQETIIAFHPAAGEGFNMQHDSYFLTGYAPGFYTISQNQHFALKTFPEFTNELTIPLGFVKNQGKQFSIELSHGVSDAIIYLTDLKTNTIHNLTQNPVYNFVSEQGEDPNRFLLKFETVGIDDLPESYTLQAYTSGNTLFVMSQHEKALVEVYNVQGQLVLSHAIEQGLQSMQTGLAPGAYIVRMISDQATATRKVVIQ
jgi:hypothetical protein